jgi:hypothetical protein
MNRSGLGRYGVSSQTVLRERTEDDEGYLICPECGTPVGNSLGSHEVARPEIVDDDLADAIGDVLVTHGWVCDRHPGYEVVMPTPVGSLSVERAVHPGWVGVRVRFADGFVRTVATPEKETRRTGVDEASTDAVDHGGVRSR